MVDSDVTARRVTATGLVGVSRARLRGLYVQGNGSIELRDGTTAAGPVKLLLNSGAGQGSNILIPSSGILFQNGIFATVTGAGTAVLFLS